MYTIYEGTTDLDVVSLFSALGLVLSLAVTSMLPADAIGWATVYAEVAGH
ncbi:hypothetical protein [Bradyrhizobium septentrionale]|uniref:Uncharacterized protein n=1 Tax=Bradyrhizobium septentrionale TaxID=1404411 RepID=A0A973W6H0_9BRAD|nr:hypothetical protein [Bradyrhizobium septentrionale]UGY17134.1 hypothetical protein HAP48_0006785 [Bradyrhizobium septentrionale]UGY25878.1 hypothetical protein HU675_0003515 [Bradyrhizobium septentrionale]